MEGVNFEIQQPNAAPGNYIPLYELDGQATFGPNGLVWPSKGQANLWEAVSGQLTNLGNDPTDAYWYDTGHGMTYGLGNVDWSQGTTGLNYTSYGDGSGDGERWTIAQGTLTQWAPFIHLDTSHGLKRRITMTTVDPIPCQYTADPNLNLKYLQSDVNAIMSGENTDNSLNTQDPAVMAAAIAQLLADAKATGVSPALQNQIQAFIGSLQPAFYVPALNTDCVNPIVYASTGKDLSFTEFDNLATSGDSTDLQVYNRDQSAYVHGTASHWVSAYAGCTLNDNGAAQSALLLGLMC
jgi:hypothetical protein